MDIALMSADEPMQENTSPLSEIEVFEDVRFLKRYKAAGLPSSFFKDGGEMSASKLLGPI